MSIVNKTQSRLSGPQKSCVIVYKLKMYKLVNDESKFKKLSNDPTKTA